MRFLLDTNIFIQAKNLHYGFGFCPAFWDWLVAQNAAIVMFLRVADSWPVADALAHSFAVVTHEVPSVSTHKSKVFNACVGLGLNCISPYETLRRERARFVLGPSPRIA